MPLGPRLREHLHDQLDVICLLEPVRAEFLAALPDALAAHAASPAGSELRRGPFDGTTWGRRGLDGIEALARGAVVAHPDELSLMELAVAAGDEGYRGLPIALHHSGSRLAVMFPHDLFDGAGVWEQLERIFARAEGLAVREVPPLLRFPVLTSLRAQGLLGKAAVDDVRRARHEADVASDVPPLREQDVVPDRERRLAGLRTVWLPPEQVSAIADAPQPADGLRETRTTRLIALVLEAAREAYPATHDIRVRMAIDLRRYAPKDRWVDGSFATTHSLGTLRTRGTSAGSIGSDLAARLASNTPLWDAAADLIALVRTRVRHPRGLPASEPGRRHFDLIVSSLPSRVPPSTWDTSDPARPPISAAVELHPREVTNPYAQIAVIEGGACISLWDETGIFDLDVFAAGVARAAHRAAGESGSALS